MNGTPADCTRFGVIAMMKEKRHWWCLALTTAPTWGPDTMYSGTVGAAKEACMLGISALAVSVTTKEEKPHFDTAARMAVVVAQEMLNRGCPNTRC